MSAQGSISADRWPGTALPPSVAMKPMFLQYQRQTVFQWWIVRSTLCCGKINAAHRDEEEIMSNAAQLPLHTCEYEHRDLDIAKPQWSIVDFIALRVAGGITAAIGLNAVRFPCSSTPERSNWQLSPTSVSVLIRRFGAVLAYQQAMPPNQDEKYYSV